MCVCARAHTHTRVGGKMLTRSLMQDANTIYEVCMKRRDSRGAHGGGGEQQGAGDVEGSTGGAQSSAPGRNSENSKNSVP
jgi:hypothetical protein